MPGQSEYATGRRKTSSARVFLTRGTGELARLREPTDEAGEPAPGITTGLAIRDGARLAVDQSKSSRSGS